MRGDKPAHGWRARHATAGVVMAVEWAPGNTARVRGGPRRHGGQLCSSIVSEVPKRAGKLFILLGCYYSVYFYQTRSESRTVLPHDCSSTTYQYV